MSRRPLLIFIFTVTLTGILNNTLVTPAIPDILTEFAVPAGRAGLLVASGAVAGIFVAPVVGFLADRFGRRIVLTSCLGLFGSFGGLAALAPTFEVLLIGRLLQGVGSAGLINLAVVLIGDHWSGFERTRLLGRNTAVLTVGLATMPLLSGVVTEAAGWRVTFGIYTVALATAAASWAILDGRRPPSPPRIREQLSNAVVVLRRPILLGTITASFLVFMLIFGLFLTVFPVHLAQAFGMEAGLRGLIISLPAITSTLAAFNLGRLRLAASARTLVVVGACGFIAAFVTLGLTGALSVLVVAVLVYGASEGSLIPTLQDLNMEWSPDEHRGAVIAVWVGAARLGQTVGPLLGGLALGVFGTGLTLAVGSIVAGAILLLGLVGPFPRQTLLKEAARP